MRALANVTRLELRKAFCSKQFLIGAGLLLLFSVLSAAYMIESQGGYNPAGVLADMENGAYRRNPDLPLYTFFNSWAGGDELSLAATLFYSLLPVGAALPFGWSWYTERKSGYLKNVCSRVDKRIYLMGKTAAVFLSGAAAVGIALAVNLLLVLAKMPLITPFAGYNFYNHVYFGNLWADLYFTVPGLYVALYVLLNIFYGGLFALLSFAVGFWVRNLFAVLLGPFLLVIAAGYAESTLINRMTDRPPVELIPTQFLHPQAAHAQIMAWAVLLVTAVLLAFSLLTIFFRGARHEIL